MNSVELAWAVHYRMYDPFVLAQLDAHLLVVTVQAEHQPHNVLLAGPDPGGAHPLAEAEQLHEPLSPVGPSQRLTLGTLAGGAVQIPRRPAQSDSP